VLKGADGNRGNLKAFTENLRKKLGK
jgi:hypothetical protein